MRLQEAFHQTINQLGQTKFLNTIWSDKGIKAALVDIATWATAHPTEALENDMHKLIRKVMGGKNAAPSAVATKISASKPVLPSDVQQDIMEDVNAFNDMAQKSPILYETMAQNIIESEVFGMAKQLPVPEACPKFNFITFNKLWMQICGEHDQLFPLKNFHDHKYIPTNAIRVVLTPDNRKENEQYNDVDTAAATPNGVFIFNKEFCQQLITWGWKKDVQPKGKKYANNGGWLDPSWCYIEFLILHELFHFSYGDFHYQKEFKLNGKLVNYTGDFRTNYLLVKSGYEQLPIGLFSDHVNLDRQHDYMEMYNLVKDEMEKLKGSKEEELLDKMQQQSDNHDHHDDDDGSEDKGGEEGKDGEEGEDGEAGKGGKAGQQSEHDINEINSRVTQKASNKGPEQQTAPEDKLGKSGPTSATGKHSTSNSSARSAFDWKNIKPTFSWESILRQCVKNGVEVDETYSKPARSSITRIAIARQTGSGAVKPGELSSPKHAKFCIVLDTSGSMHSHVSLIMANIMKLVKNNGAQKFYFMSFSGSADLWEMDIKSKKATKIDLEKLKPVGITMTYEAAISSGEFGGTDFNSRVVDSLINIGSKGWNILLATDLDIIGGENMVQWKRYMKHIPHNFTILAAHSDFTSACERLGKIPKNITCIQ